MDLLKSLMVVSEKAANIARTCRQDRHLFELLVQEKCADEANPRFVRDFKTLADVLIQETLRHDVGAEFAGLKERIRGEENNIFSNRLGETIKVGVLGTVEETIGLLKKVLNDDLKAASLLAEEVHRQIELEDVDVDVDVERDIPQLDSLDVNSLSIWIDPIDSTSEYISGIEAHGCNGVHLSGLRCVTVLIGVYDRLTGSPVIGVVNQPFHRKTDDNRWRGKCFWGINTSTTLLSSLPTSVRSHSSSTNVVCVSSSEDTLVKSKLRRGGYTLVEAAGAGYKLLAVILGLADAYVLTKDSTFKWDTCGPQAILAGSGGGLIVWKKAVGGDVVAVDYNDEANASVVEEEKKIDRCCNRGGIVAYRNELVLKSILETFRQ